MYHQLYIFLLDFIKFLILLYSLKKKIMGPKYIKISFLI